MPDHLDIEHPRPQSAILPRTTPLVQEHDDPAGDVTMDDV
jgi:F-box and WD-40 domain protein CDC4